MAGGLTEMQKLRAELAAKIVAAQLPEGLAGACHAAVTAYAKQVAAGAVKIADEIILAASR